jgi:hypothetical protein
MVKIVEDPFLTEPDLIKLIDSAKPVFRAINTVLRRSAGHQPLSEAISSLSRVATMFQ